MPEDLSMSTDSLSVVLSGQAGQGIQTVEYIITRLLKLSGYNVFSTKEYMSRVRGGTNSTEIRISSRRVCAPVDQIDIFVPLSQGAIPHLKRRISSKTLILGQKEILGNEYHKNGQRVIEVPFSKIASEIGSPIYSNTVAVGVISGLLKVELGILTDYLKQHFSAKGESVIRKNIQAAEKGHRIALDLLSSGRIKFKIPRSLSVTDEILLNGTEAVALGAIAGGCNFLSFYPMSPATGVSVFLARHSEDFDIIVEQVEDEICALNMVIGAWYAGGRAMASTSGGGFALMEEGLSLAGMLESPVVIHLAQRPGPATGLPTRTEQADLELALYAGQGEFPRIILAPGTIEDAFYLTQSAFNLADKYQVPVFVLTDQYLLDSYYNIASLDLSGMKIEKHTVKTDQEYKRYRLTEKGISPRGIPGYGDGIVVVDSDEHDEEGHITEDLDIRQRMVEKRLKKLELISNEIISPQLIGSENYRILLLGWGSTYHVIKEALHHLKREDLSFLHFSQVYPLHPDTTEYLKRAEKTVVIENNATSQFGRLIRLHTGIEIEKRVLKYNGLPFSVEEIVRNLKPY